jgi:hypothetical protein
MTRGVSLAHGDLVDDGAEIEEAVLDRRQGR